jgi:hypothetical protein
MNVEAVKDKFNGHNMWCEQCDHEWSTDDWIRRNEK